MSAASGCRANSRAVLINFFCPRSGAYSKAVLIRVNTVMSIRLIFKQ